MENTLENKAKFFAQYWGQKIVNWNRNIHIQLKPNILINDTDEFDILELTPLSQITDEDAKELMKIKLISSGVEERNIDSIILDSKTRDGFTFIVKYHTWADERQGFVLDGKTNGSYFYDYLRSKGYALPWMGLSVEQQIKFGWVKLKEN